MTEKMKRRIPKWDVAAELHVDTVGDESALLEKVDDPCMNLTVVDSMNPIISMNVDGSDVNQSATQSGEDGNNNIIHSDDICEKTHFSGQFDPEDDCKFGLKKQDCEPASQDRTIAEHIENQDKSHKAVYDMPLDPEERHQRTRIMSSKDFSEQFDPEDDCKFGLKKQDWEPASQDRTIAEHTENQDKSHKAVYDMPLDPEERHQRTRNMSSKDFSEQFDPEDDCKFGLKKQDWEPASQDRTIAEHTENQDKSHKAVYDMPLDPEERHQRTRNMSPVDGRSRVHRKRSRSRSPSHDSRSRSRSLNESRCKSPSYVSKQGSERWTDKGRMRGMTEACRAFAAGKCRRGNECSYLHESGCLRQIDRHHGSGLTDGRGIRLEREKQLVSGSNETLTDTGERDKFSREKLSWMHEEHHEDGSATNIQHHGYRSTERCFDFTMGRCFRGETCRYIHHDASSDGGWSVKDEFRGRVHDRRGESASFTRGIQHQKFSDRPCKYFLRGHCLHGEGCRFHHQLGPLNIPVERSVDGRQHSFVSGGPAGNITSANASEHQDQTAQFSSRGKNMPGVSDTQTIDKQNFSKRSLCDGHRKPHSSEQQATTTSEVCEELSVNNPLPTTLIGCQNVESRGQNQSAPQILHAQNLTQNSSTQQFSHPIPLKGQMLQVRHSHYQNGKNQLAALDKPPDAHSFNANIQNHPSNPSSYQLNPKNQDPRGKVQQNLSMLSHSGSNFNHNGQIQQNRPLIHNSQNQPDFNVGSHNQQILASHGGRGLQDIAGDSQNILPQNAQSQVPNVPAHVSNGQNNRVAVPPPSLNPQIPNSDDSISHKVVTSEQAAKITDLSASLAQFFGSTAHNSQSSSAMTPQPFLNPNPIGSAFPVAPLPTEVEASQTILSHSTPKHNEQIKEAHGAKSQNGDADSGKGADTNKIKEAKEIRLFKCALVEFVKDTLKPKWKEGQLSKEAYKIIVKKVVEKVCGSLQGPNIPQTQEKIDLYLLNCKAKLTKLVQAYVEKFAL